MVEGSLAKLYEYCSMIRRAARYLRGQQSLDEMQKVAGHLARAWSPY
jgi:flagellin-specific chaperone FliS